MLVPRTKATTTSTGSTRAVRPVTRIRRIAQMLDELRAGQGYKGMVWSQRLARRRRSE